MFNKKPLNNPFMAAAWSMVWPGFGQMYNRDYILGTLLIILEVVINIFSHLNTSIYYSFNGQFQEALRVFDFQWGLFYPSFYAFSIWQAFDRARKMHQQVGPEGNSYHNGVLMGFGIGMVLGVIWCRYILIAPVLSGILTGFIGALLGFAVERILKRKNT